jgi:putative tricarboxylic transport membrane protein
MRTGEILAAIFWLACAVGVTAAGWRLGLGSASDPGSGFMIFWVGVAMIALSVSALAIALRQPAGEALASLWRGLRWWVVPYVTALLVLYAWALPTLGFVLVTGLLLVILFKTIEPQGWLAAIGGAVLSTAAVDLVFHRWLGTQLPAGTVLDRLSAWIF